jgi:hypothetical protein
LICISWAKGTGEQKRLDKGDKKGGSHHNNDALTDETRTCLTVSLEEEASARNVFRIGQPPDSFWTIQEIGLTLQTDKEGQVTKALGHHSTVRS